MTSSTDLAALLCSRLCHDLLSPVGALSNGLELLADEKDPEMRRRCFELLEQSAKISTDKLEFFRLAYGAAGGFGDVVPTEEPKELVAALVQHRPADAVVDHAAGCFRVDASTRHDHHAVAQATLDDEQRPGGVDPRPW